MRGAGVAGQGGEHQGVHDLVGVADVVVGAGAPSLGEVTAVEPGRHVQQRQYRRQQRPLRPRSPLCPSSLTERDGWDAPRQVWMRLLFRILH